MNHEHSSSDSFKNCYFLEILSQLRNNLHFIQYKKWLFLNNLSDLTLISNKFYLY